MVRGVGTGRCGFFGRRRTGAQKKKAISIATGGTGGVYYPLGGGLANVLSNMFPASRLRLEVTGGSVDNLKLINSRQSELAFVMADAALDALQGRRQVQGQPGRGAHPDGALPEPHARGDDRGERHREDGRPQGQAHLHRLARQRDRGHGLPRHRGRGPRQGQGHATRAARCRRIRQRAQGRQDRRVLLGRRAADRRRHRSRRHARTSRSR